MGAPVKSVTESWRQRCGDARRRVLCAPSPSPDGLGSHPGRSMECTPAEFAADLQPALPRLRLGREKVVVGRRGCPGASSVLPFGLPPFSCSRFSCRNSRRSLLQRSSVLCCCCCYWWTLGSLVRCSDGAGAGAGALRLRRCNVPARPSECWRSASLHACMPPRSRAGGSRLDSAVEAVPPRVRTFRITVAFSASVASGVHRSVLGLGRFLCCFTTAAAAATPRRAASRCRRFVAEPCLDRVAISTSSAGCCWSSAGRRRVSVRSAPFANFACNHSVLLLAVVFVFSLTPWLPPHSAVVVVDDVRVSVDLVLCVVTWERGDGDEAGDRAAYKIVVFSRTGTGIGIGKIRERSAAFTKLLRLGTERNVVSTQ